MSGDNEGLGGGRILPEKESVAGRAADKSAKREAGLARALDQAETLLRDAREWAAGNGGEPLIAGVLRQLVSQLAVDEATLALCCPGQDGMLFRAVRSQKQEPSPRDDFAPALHDGTVRSPSEQSPCVRSLVEPIPSIAANDPARFATLVSAPNSLHSFLYFSGLPGVIARFGVHAGPQRSFSGRDVAFFDALAGLLLSELRRATLDFWKGRPAETRGASVRGH